MESPVKSFVLRHTFENVSSMKEDVNVYSDEEEHFGIPWKIRIARKSGFLYFYLDNMTSLDRGIWMVKAQFTPNIKAKTGEMNSLRTSTFFENWTGYNKSCSVGTEPHINWDVIKNDFLVNDKLTAKSHVLIEKTFGFYEPNLRQFAYEAEEISDLKISVNGLFFVSRLFLASQSDYLRTTLMEEFKKSETIHFNYMAKEDFQKFLELLYGDPAINECTVEGILAIGSRLQTPTVIRRCVEFLIEKSKKPLKKKLQMAFRYGLVSLGAHCLALMKSNAKNRPVLPSDENSSTWTIIDVDINEFPKYLEVLFGYSDIDESNVEGVVAIAQELEIPSVVKQCEEFLIEKSTKDLKKKLQMAISYDLEELKSHCLGSVKSIADVHSLVPSDITQMDCSMIDILFQKMLTF